MSNIALPNIAGDKGQPGKRWVNRDWIESARLQQRRGSTLSEIADQLDMDRSAVVKALYWDTLGDSK